MKIKWNFDYSLTFPALRNVIEISSGKFGWVSVLKHCHQNPVFLLLGFTFIWVGFILRKVCLCDVKSPFPPTPTPCPHVPSYQGSDPGWKRGPLSDAPVKVSGDAFIGSARVICPSITQSQRPGEMGYPDWPGPDHVLSSGAGSSRKPHLEQVSLREGKCWFLQKHSHQKTGELVLGR